MQHAWVWLGVQFLSLLCLVRWSTKGGLHFQMTTATAKATRSAPHTHARIQVVQEPSMLPVKYVIYTMSYC
jgi:hypothetical protein